MLKSLKKISRLLLGLIILTAIFYSVNIAFAQIESQQEIEKKSAEISAEEGRVLQNLFQIVQEAEALGREEAGIAREMSVIEGELQQLEKKISRDTDALSRKQDILRQILQSYQRRGPGSDLEILLNSDSLADFIRRINTMRDLAKGTGAILDALDASKKILLAEKRETAVKLGSLKEKSGQLTAAIGQTKQKQEEKEVYLASLKEKNAQYRNQLAEIENEWDQLKAVFSAMIQEISRAIATGNLEAELPPDAMKVTFSLSGVKGTIKEQAFNQIINSYASLPEMAVSFRPNIFEVSLPGKNIVLQGTLDILDDHNLKFTAHTGSFRGLARIFDSSILIDASKALIWLIFFAFFTFFYCALYRTVL